MTKALKLSGEYFLAWLCWEVAALIDVKEQWNGGDGNLLSPLLLILMLIAIVVLGVIYQHFISFWHAFVWLLIFQTIGAITYHKLIKES